MLMYLFTDFAVSLTLISVIIYLFIPIADILLMYTWNGRYWNNSQTTMCYYLSYIVIAWDHALSLFSLYVSHGKRAWYISLSDFM